jgi:hypothetical protein
MEKETCQNCKCTIGKLEQAYVFHGDVVCQNCYQKLTDLISERIANSNRSVKNSIWLLVLASFLGVIIIIYFTMGLFVIQPIGAIPDGTTILYWRIGTNMPFISSADGILDEKVGSVSLLGRATTLAAVGKIMENRKILNLPYSKTLYLISTDGKEFRE